MNIKPRLSPPTALTTMSGEQSFRVWCHSPTFMEDPTPWRCVASFRFLQECLDYIAHLQDSGVDCVFQSPARTELVRHSDRRVVYVPENAVRSMYRVMDAVCH